jgi:hypothetical protein
MQMYKLRGLLFYSLNYCLNLHFLYIIFFKILMRQSGQIAKYSAA